MSHRQMTRLVREGDCIAEVSVDFIETEGGWSPYLTLDNAYRLTVNESSLASFLTIEQDLGPLGERYQSFITVLELVRVEQHLPCCRTLRGRPQHDRAALARAFIAKAVFQIDTTRALRERLANDRALRRLCGWESIRALPSEATFSRAFAEFAEGPCRAAYTRR